MPTGVDPALMNLWYAIVNQTFRVRVTAVIESDDRLVATFPADRLSSPTLHLNAVAVRRPGWKTPWRTSVSDGAARDSSRNWS